MPVIEHWECWCHFQAAQGVPDRPTAPHTLADVQRCPDCGDYAPGYHTHPLPKPYWWDWPETRMMRIRQGLASPAEVADYEGIAAVRTPHNGD